MLERENEESDAQLNTIKEADAEELAKRELWEHPEVLEFVVERKKRKFTRNGLVWILIGLVMIAPSIMLKTGANSVAGLIAGIGVFVILVGILRILIGLIRPIVPSQL
jgi:hypothetical protein